MIPTSVGIGSNVEITNARDMPSKTWGIDWANKRIAGMIDEREAMIQAIYLVLRTERFQSLILPHSYGIEANALIGRSKTVTQSEIRRVITDALLADPRIAEVSGFEIIQISRRKVLVSFDVSTIFGEVSIEGVPLDV